MSAGPSRAGPASRPGRILTRLRPSLESTQGTTRVLAILRLLLLPIVFAGDRLVDHETVGTSRFDVVIVIAAVYSVLVLADNWRDHGPLLSPTAQLSCDMLLVAALTYESGGAFSHLGAAFLALPLGAALLSSPRRTAGVALASGLLYLLVAIAHPETPEHRRLAIALGAGLYVAWDGVVAVLLATVLNARRRRIAELSEARARLVAQAATAEERARRRLSDQLHDEVVQTVLTARQDLAEARLGNGEMLDSADLALKQAIGQLRQIIVDLHPTYLFDHLGLGAALEAIARQQAARGHFTPHFHIDPAAAEPHDQLVLSLARELLTNAARHSQAANVVVSLARDGDDVVLEVSDDGRGFSQWHRLTALRAGHIGLASLRERVEVAGGELEISSGPGQGASVCCRIPAGQLAAPGLEPAAPGLEPAAL